MGFNCLKATEPLQKDSLIFIAKSPGVRGTHLINLIGMEDGVELQATQWF